MQAGEECDDGNPVDDDGCSNACALPLCGDSIVQMGEECDDGNPENTDTCLDTCVLATCGDTFVGPRDIPVNGNHVALLRRVAPASRAGSPR